MTSEYQKNYYSEHKANILQLMARPEYEFCKQCNKTVSHGYMARHQKSKRHLRLSKNISEDYEKHIEMKLKEVLLRLLV